jgi:hypothetical protein
MGKQPSTGASDARYARYVEWLTWALGKRRTVTLIRFEDQPDGTTAALHTVPNRPGVYAAGLQVRVELSGPEGRASVTARGVPDALDVISRVARGGWEWEQWVKTEAKE